MTHKITPTGKTRHRAMKRWFGPPLMVLQVQERHEGYIQDEHGSGPDFNYLEWRDAIIQDLTVKDRP